MAVEIAPSGPSNLDRETWGVEMHHAYALGLGFWPLALGGKNLGPWNHRSPKPKAQSPKTQAPTP